MIYRMCTWYFRYKIKNSLVLKIFNEKELFDLN